MFCVAKVAKNKGFVCLCVVACQENAKKSHGDVLGVIV